MCPPEPVTFTHQVTQLHHTIGCRHQGSTKVRELQRGLQPAWLADDVNQIPSRSAGLRRPRVHGRRWFVISAGAAAAVVAAAVIIVPRLTAPTAYAATPPSLTYTSTSVQGSAADVLAELADRARRQPAPPGAGQSALLKVLAEEPGLIVEGTTTDRAAKGSPSAPISNRPARPCPRCIQCSCSTLTPECCSTTNRSHCRQANYPSTLPPPSAHRLAGFRLHTEHCTGP